MVRRYLSRGLLLSPLWLVVPAGTAHAADNIFQFVVPSENFWDGSDANPLPWSLGSIPAVGENVFFVNTTGSDYTLVFRGPANDGPLGSLSITSVLQGSGERALFDHSLGDMLTTHNLLIGSIADGEVTGGIGVYNLHGGVLEVSADPVTLTSGNVFLGEGLGGIGTFTQDNFSGQSAIVNISGPATDQNGTFGGYLFVGYAEGSSGSYSISEDPSDATVSLTVQREIQIGGSNVHGFTCTNNEFSCSGVFEQNGGTVAAGGVTIGIGSSIGASTGSYNLVAGTLEAAGAIDVGNSTTGTFTQSGGEATAPYIFVGNGTGSRGQVQLSGGTLTSTAGDVEGSTQIGIFGTGEFLQSGGTHQAFAVTLGTRQGGIGSYSIDGTDGPSTLDIFFVLGVGVRGEGSFLQKLDTTVTASHLLIANAADSIGEYLMEGGQLSLRGTATIGHGGVGTLTQTGGQISVGTDNDHEVLGNDVWIGRAAGSTGTFNLSETTGGESPTTFSVSGSLVVGGSGIGVVNHSGGELTAQDTNIGGNFHTGEPSDPGGSEDGRGTYNLSGTGVINAGFTNVGQNGEGIVNQVGGTFNATGMVIGSSGLNFLDGFYRSGGTYNLTAGALNNSGELTLALFGKGEFFQSGESTHSVGRDLIVGWGPALPIQQDTGIPNERRSGAYTLDGGLLEIAGYEIIGRSNAPGEEGPFDGEPGGLGTFTQNGGIHRIGASLVIGQSGSVGGGQGSFILTGGQLDVAVDVFIGSNGLGDGTIGGGLIDGRGSFVHSGGEVNIVGALNVSGAQGVGTYALSGSDSVLNTAITYVNNAAAVFTQSGGTHNAATALNHFGGQYNISGGVVNTANMGVAGPFDDAMVNQTGGIVNVTNSLASGFGLYVGSFGNEGTYNLGGGSLNVTGTTHLGDAGPGAFNQTGGTHTTGRLLISENSLGAATGDSTYVLAAGTLNAPVVLNRGTFRMNSGAVITSSSFTNQANGVVRGNGDMSGVTISNHGLVLAESGTLTTRIDGQSGTVQIDSAATLSLSGASDAAILKLNGGTLQTNNFAFTVDEDYTNTGFGSGNSFNARANVLGTGAINASGTTTQALTGTLTGGSSSAATMALGNTRVGGTLSGSYVVSNTGSAGPTLRGAIQTTAGGATIGGDGRFSGAGTTAGDFALAAGASTLSGAVNFQSNGADAGAVSRVIRIANNFDNVADQDITVTASVFREATATIAPNPVDAGFVHVGGNRGFSVNVANTGIADGFTEDLSALVTGSSSNLAASGSVIDLAAGNNSNAITGLITATSVGVNTGVVNLALTSGGLTSNSGLAATTPIGSNVDVIVKGVDFANPTVQLTLDFGNVLRNSVQQRALSVTNSVLNDAAFQEALNANFTTTSAPGITALSGSIERLLAGATDDSSLQVQLDTSSVGAFTGSATVALQSDGFQFGLGTTSLGTRTVSVLANITGVVGDLATAEVAPTTVNFGDYHVNSSTATQNISVGNGTAVGEGLIVSVGAPSGGFGLTNNLPGVIAAGTSVADGLVVAVDRNLTGDQGGTVALGFVSDGTFSGSQTTLAGQTITVIAKGYALASGSVAPDGLVVLSNVHVGQSASASFDVTNIGANTGGFTENLDASLTGAAGGLVGGVSGLARGETAVGAFNVAFDTSSAGSKTASATVDFRSNGAGINSLGVTDIADGTISAQVSVFNLAQANTLASSIALSSRRVGESADSATIAIANVAPAGAFTEGLDYSTSGLASPFSSSGDVAATNLAVGVSNSVGVSLSTATSGTFSDTLEVSFASNGSVSGLADTVLAGQFVAISGNVYQTATAELTGGASPAILDFGTVRVGDAVSLTRTLTNVATGALVDDLTGTLSGPASPFSATDDGLAAGLAGNGGSTNITFRLDTTNAGSYASAAALALRSHNDEMLDVAVDGFEFTMSGTVNNLADADVAFVSGDGTFNGNNLLYVWDFGVLNQSAAGVRSAEFAVRNVALGPADNLSGHFDTTGAGPFVVSGFEPFFDLVAGGDFMGLRVNFDSAGIGPGVISRSVFLDSTSVFAGLRDVALGRIELRFTGRIDGGGVSVPAPATALLVMFGAIGVLAARRRREKN